MTYRIAFSAGEYSGDEHLSEILSALKKKFPDAEFRGLAGPKVRSIGITTELALEEYASVMGFADVLRAAPKIFSALAWFKRTFSNWKPDLLVIVDYPDFNLKLAKIAKQSGSKVFYYIPPKIWIWRAGRIKKIKALVDRVALIFPFEKSFYEKLGFHKSVYVGHPFQESLIKEDDPEKEQQYRSDFLRSLDLNPAKPIIAFFPGSRKSEIRRHWPGMVAGLNLLNQRIPDIQVLLSIAAPVKELIEKQAEKAQFKCISVEGRNLEILRFASVGLIKSGTSNLQAAFYGLPFVMYYQASLISELIVRCFIKIRRFSMVNIIRPGSVVELLQGSGSPEKIADELETLIKNEARQKDVKQGLKEVQSMLSTFEPLPIFAGSQRAAQRAAILAAELLEPISKVSS